jgi:hypothetical protein
MNNYYWVSIDPGKTCQGVALWYGRDLLWAVSIWETKTGAFVEKRVPGGTEFTKTKHESLYAAWQSLNVIGNTRRVVVEQSSIKSIKSTMVIGEMRGLVMGWLGWRSVSPDVTSFHMVDPSIWQGASQQLWGLVWPKGNYEISKATSTKIASDYLKADLKGHDDLADAVCVGLWYIGTGQVEL